MRFWSLAFFVSSIFFLTYCGGEGGTTSSPTTDTINIEGLWSITETKIEDCPDWETQQYDLHLTQDDNNITIEDEDGNTFNGILNGFKLSWDGSYSESLPSDIPGIEIPGITTINLLTTTIDSSCNSLIGVADWTWNATDGSGSTCSGKTTFTGTRTLATGCGFDVPPVAPSNLKATAETPDQIYLFWDDNSTNETNFVVESSATSGSEYSFLTSTAAGIKSYTHTGLNEDTIYYYRVYAKNDAGDSNYSNETYARTPLWSSFPPIVPINLTATLVAEANSAQLNWTDVINETSYLILRNDSPYTGMTFLAEVEENITIYLDEGLNEDTQYGYCVKAHNDEGDSSCSPSVYVITKPSTPSNLTATTISSTSIRLDWTDESDYENGFKIFLSPDWGQPYFLVGEVDKGVQSYIQEGLTPSNIYIFSVAAYNDAGDSPLIEPGVAGYTDPP